MKKLPILIISILALTILTGCGKPDLILNDDLLKLEDEGDLSTYYNEKYDFVFAHPSEWNVEESFEKTFPNQAIVLKFQKNDEDKPSDALEFSVYKKMSTEDLYDEIRDPNVPNPSSGLFTTNHQFTIYNGTEQKSGRQIRRYVLVDGNKAFVGDLYDVQKEYEDLLLTVLDSFNY